MFLSLSPPPPPCCVVGGVPAVGCRPEGDPAAPPGSRGPDRYHVGARKQPAQPQRAADSQAESGGGQGELEPLAAGH